MMMGELEVYVVKVETDAAWGSAAGSRSVSGCIMRLNGLVLLAYSRTQKVIAHSSCEAEIVSIHEGVCEGKFALNLLKEMNINSTLEVCTDSCSAIKFAMKRGVGRMKHLQLKCTSLQDDLRDEVVVMKYVKAEDNTADFLTKGLKTADFLKHRQTVGVCECPEPEQDHKRVTTPASCAQIAAASILAVQVQGAQAMSKDVEFLMYCWLLSCGVLLLMLVITWLAVRCLWLVCGRRPNHITRTWDGFIRTFMIESDMKFEVKYMYTTKTGDKAHFTKCSYVVDSSDSSRVRPNVHVWEICSQCRKHKYR